MGKQIKMTSEQLKWLRRQPKPVREYIEALLAKGYVLVKKVGRPDYELVHESRVKR